MKDDVGYDVLGTKVADNGAMSCQTGDSVNREVICDNAEWWQHVGFASRPATSVPGQSACQVISTETTGRDVCYASRDLRGLALYKGLGPGETTLYADGPNATGTGLVHLKDDGTTATVSLSVRQGNAPGGAPIEAKLASTGEVTISTGTCTVTIDGQSGTIVLDAGSAKITVDGSTGKVEVQGSTVALGGPTGLPVVTENGQLAVFFTAIASAFSGLGIVVVPPTGFTSTTTTAT